MGILIHAQRMMTMLDSTLGLLGPDHELLTEILADTGARHVKFGVKVSYIPYLGKALSAALGNVLGSQWTSEVAQAWNIVMDELAADIMNAIAKAEQAESAAIAAVSLSSGASSSRSLVSTDASSCFSCASTCFSCDGDDLDEMDQPMALHKSPRKVGGGSSRAKLGRCSMPRTLPSLLGSSDVDDDVNHSPKKPTKKKTNKLGLGAMSRALQGFKI
jgi:hypothetical protein